MKEKVIKLLCLDDGLDIIGQNMLQRLSKHGFEVFFGRDNGNLKEFRHVKLPPIKSKLCFSAIWAIRKFIKSEKIDVVYAPSSRGLSCALFATLFTKVKVVGYRGTGAKIRRIDLSYYLGVLNPRIAKIVCGDESIREMMKNFVPAEKVVVNRKPYDVQWVESALKNPVIPESVPANAFKVIYVANCKDRPYKGLSVLVDAMSYLPENAHLIFVGSYGNDDFVRAQKSSLANRIHFVGVRSDAIHFLPKSDLFVLPSLRDLSPRSVREAMACALPCVISNIPGARDLGIEGKTCLLAKAGDAIDFADKIKKFIDDKTLAKTLGNAGRERIIRDFSPENYAQIFKETFNSVL